MKCSVTLLGLALVTSVALAQEGDVDQAVQLETVQVDVISGDSLSCRIEAGKGRMDSNSREVWLERPRVQLYNDNAEVRDSGSGERAHLWPEKVLVEEAGKVKETTKYDWELDGGVVFSSIDGYRLEAETLRFSYEKYALSSPEKISYRIPTGRGSVLLGNAQKFEAEIDRASGQLKSWRLAGGVEFTSAAEEEKP